MSEMRKLDLEQFALTQECAKEPIHIPGGIQPSGCMLLLERDTLRILAASSNLADWLDVEASEALGGVLSDVLDERQHAFFTRALAESAREPGGYVLVDEASGLWIRAQDASQGIFMELEHHRANAAFLEQGYRHVWRTLHRIEHVEHVESLAQFLAEEVRELTGYDRVCIYRFAEDASGEVIGEARAQGVESFLGLKYPASDIPEQARKMYVAQPLRPIAWCARRSAGSFRWSFGTSRSSSSSARR